MKTKIGIALEEFCDSDYLLMKKEANRLSEKRNIPFPSCGLTIKEDAIEVDKDQLDRLAKIAELKGVKITHSSEEKLNRHLREEKQQVKIGKLPLKCKNMFLLFEKMGNLYNLTDNQQNLIQFIFDFFQEEGRFPSVRDTSVGIEGTNTENIIKSLPKGLLISGLDLEELYKEVYRLTLFGILHAKGSESYKSAIDYMGKQLKEAIKNLKVETVKFDNNLGLKYINKQHKTEVFELLAQAWSSRNSYHDEYFEIYLPNEHNRVSLILNYTDPITFCRSRYVRDEELRPGNIDEVPAAKLLEPIVTDKKEAAGVSEEKIIKLIEYKTNDPFRKGHIKEINRAYTYRCYTSVFILCRKVIENMIIDILRKNFPPSKKENKVLYYDIDKKRFKDFSIILDNFYKKRKEFDLDKKIVERIVSLAKPFKKEANDKVHSWFHLVRKKKEIDDIDIQGMIDLIKKLEERI